MAEKQELAAFAASTRHELTQAVCALSERQAITSAQHVALLHVLAGYLPASFDLAQRTPRSTVYIRAQTPDDTFELSIGYRGAVKYG